MKYRNIKLNVLLFITFFLISVLPILIIALASYRIIPDNIENNAVSKNEVIAQVISERIQEVLLSSQRALMLILENSDSTGEQLAFKKLVRTYFPIFSMIQLADPNGMVQSVYPQHPIYLHSDLSRQPLFRALKKQPPLTAHWSEVFMFPETGNPTITVGIRNKSYSLIGYIDLSILHDIVRKTRISPGGYVMITDKNGTIIAHKDFQVVKEQRHFDYKRIFGNGTETIQSSIHYIEQRQFLGSMVKNQLTGWPIIVQQPLEEIYDVAQQLVYTIAIVLVAVMIFSLMLAMLFFVVITKPIDRLVENAKEIERGNYTRSISTNSYYEMNMLEQSFQQMSKAIEQRETDLSKALREKIILMREINHRVKNNLILLYSLFELQISKSDNPAEIETLKDVNNRIQSIALIHKLLYESELYDEINLSEFIGEFKNLLHASFDQFNIDIIHYTNDVVIDITKAIPCGLILNELVTNAVKHAFCGESGKIEITLVQEKDLVTLSVSDNGKGLPDDFDINRSDSLGLNLVKMLSGQIQGTLQIDGTEGTTFTIQFKTGINEEDHHR